MEVGEQAERAGWAQRGEVLTAEVATCEGAHSAQQQQQWQQQQQQQQQRLVLLPLAGHEERAALTANAEGVGGSSSPPLFIPVQCVGQGEGAGAGAGGPDRSLQQAEGAAGGQPQLLQRLGWQGPLQRRTNWRFYWMWAKRLLLLRAALCLVPGLAPG